MITDSDMPPIPTIQVTSTAIQRETSGLDFLLDLTLSGPTATSEHYTAAVKAHSELSKENTLYPGINYRQFAQFLNQPQSELSQESSSSHTGNERRVPVLVHSLSGADRNIKQYDEGVGHLKFTRDHHQASSGGQLIFLQGFPSASWIKTIGARYRVDPEFFRRYLDFLQTKDHHELPSLPSSSCNIISLRITTICKRTLVFSQKQVMQARNEALEAVRRHQRTLVSKNLVGESIVRRYSVYDETTFAIEQNVTICVKRKNNAWIACICSDTGRDLTYGSHAPWLNDQPGLDNTCLPVIQHVPKIALRSHQKDFTPERPPATQTSNTTQSASLLPSDYGASLNRNIMNVDPRYALTEVFAFVAASECQFLNMLQCQIDRELQFFESQMKWSLASLRYYKASLDSHAQQLEATLISLKQLGMFSQPILPQTGQPPNEQDARMRKDQSGESEIADSTVQSLVADFEHLFRQASRLADKCVEGTTIIVNHAMLEGSRKAIHHAERSGRLTLLAFFFLPLSLTTSFFGMNFVELGTGKLSIWYAFAISVPVLLLSAAICFWDSTIIAFRKRSS